MNSWDYLQIYLETNIHNDLGFNITITDTPYPSNPERCLVPNVRCGMLHGDAERNCNNRPATPQAE